MNDRQLDHLFGLLERMLRCQVLLVKQRAETSEAFEAINEIGEYLNK